MSAKMTKREELIAEFAYKCCEKGDNIDMMWFRLRQMFTEPENPARARKRG